MKKVITLAILAAVALTATNANAISEGYRKQLEREQKTQLQEAHAANSAFPGLRTYTGGANGMYLIEADKNCVIKTVNGFPPKPAKRIDDTLTAYPSAIGTTFLAFKTAKGCKYMFNYNGVSGGLAAR